MWRPREYRTWNRVERADIVLWVMDVSKNIDEQDQEILERLKENNDTDVIVVRNKTDLKARKDIENKDNSFSLPTVNVSAKTGQGLDELKDIHYKYHPHGKNICYIKRKISAFGRRDNSNKQTTG